MNQAPTKNLPRPTPDTQPFWDACRKHRLLIQHCKSCGHHQFYPRLVCSECLGLELEWVEASGRGVVRSFTILRQAISPAYADDVPYVVALIRLEEGPTMMSNVVDCDAESVHIGMAVEVLFSAYTDEITVPQFRPTGST